MIIDIATLSILAWGLIHGFRKGLVIAIFNFVGFFLGLFAALKFSDVAASYLDAQFEISSAWMPLISFATVFLLVIILIRLGSGLITKMINFVQLGIFNKIAGGILVGFIHLMIISTILWMVNQAGWLSTSMKTGSHSWNFIEAFAPGVFYWLSFITPVFSELFDSLEAYFDALFEEI